MRPHYNASHRGSVELRKQPSRRSERNSLVCGSENRGLVEGVFLSAEEVMLSVCSQRTKMCSFLHKCLTSLASAAEDCDGFRSCAALECESANDVVWTETTDRRSHGVQMATQLNRFY